MDFIIRTGLPSTDDCCRHYIALQCPYNRRRHVIQSASLPDDLREAALPERAVGVGGTHSVRVDADRDDAAADDRRVGGALGRLVLRDVPGGGRPEAGVP